MENKNASLVVIIQDVEHTYLVVFLPPVCYICKMDYCTESSRGKQDEVPGPLEDMRHHCFHRFEHGK